MLASVSLDLACVVVGERGVVELVEGGCTSLSEVVLLNVQSLLP